MQTEHCVYTVAKFTHQGARELSILSITQNRPSGNRVYLSESISKERSRSSCNAMVHAIM